MLRKKAEPVSNQSIILETLTMIPVAGIGIGGDRLVSYLWGESAGWGFVIGYWGLFFYTIINLRKRIREEEYNKLLKKVKMPEGRWVK